MSEIEYSMDHTYIICKAFCNTFIFILSCGHNAIVDIHLLLFWEVRICGCETVMPKFPNRLKILFKNISRALLEFFFDTSPSVRKQKDNCIEIAFKNSTNCGIHCNPLEMPNGYKFV